MDILIHGSCFSKFLFLIGRRLLSNVDGLMGLRLRNGFVFVSGMCGWIFIVVELVGVW